METKHQNRGLVKVGKNQTAITNLPLSILRPDYILVRTVAVALNPADWQNLDENFGPGADAMLLGNDVAGIVEGVGENLSGRWTPGDRIICCVHGVNVTNPQDGAFAEHVQARGDIATRIPSYMSFTEAVALPGGLLTVALGFYKHLELPFPPTKVPEGTWIFVYGGSSATGTVAIQFAKLSGFKVVTTCSPRNFGLVKGLGADVAYDYRDPQCGEKIRALTSDSLFHVFDTIATPEAAKISASAMGSRKGGIYCNLMGVDAPRDDIKSVFFLAYSAMGRPFMYEGEERPLAPEDYEIAKRFTVLAEKLLEQGKIKPHPATVRGGGLAGIPEGVEDLRKGKVSGEKLVYVIGGEI